MSDRFSITAGLLKRSGANILLSVIISCIILGTPAFSQAADQAIRIGVLSYQGYNEAVKMWSATAVYLTDKIPGYSFTDDRDDIRLLNDLKGKSFMAVDELMVELKVGPHKDLGVFAWRDVVTKYRYVLVPGIAGVSLLILITSFVVRLNRKLQRAHAEIQTSYDRLTGEIDGRKRIEHALRKSDEKLRDLFETSQDGIYWTDGDGIFTAINSAAARMFGHQSPEEIIGQKAEKYWQRSEDRQKYHAILEAEKEVTKYPVPARQADGRLVDLELSGRLMTDDAGNIVGTQGILRDTTERREKERKLLSNQEELSKKHSELQALFTQIDQIKKEWEQSMDCSDDMMILVDQSGRIKRCNRAVKTFAGKEYGVILQRDYMELLRECGLINDPITNGKNMQNIELYHEPSARWFMLNSYPYEDKSLGLSGQVLMIHDFSEIAKMTKAIEENNEKLKNALDELTDLIQQVTKMKDFSVRFSNPNLVRCYEVKSCNMLDCPCYGLEETRCWQVSGTFCGSGDNRDFNGKIENCMECSVFQIATEDPVYQIGENFNNMMHILEQQHIELQHAYNELKVAESQLVQQEKMASIGQLAAGVAHEINNPMGYIMSNIATFQRYMVKLSEFLKVQDAAVAGLPQEMQDEISVKRKSLKVDFIMEDLVNLTRESLDGAERVNKIVQDLKSFSRVDESEQKMADINAGIESTLNIVWNELKYKATVKKEYGNIPLIKCNPGQLNQVVMNILVNAAHAIEKMGEIGVRTWAHEGNIFVSISDNGCGIPADKVTRIFEPFYTTKKIGKGTGLGLSIAYDIVKKHKGEIRVESEVGKGSTFTIRIPVMEAI